MRHLALVTLAACGGGSSGPKVTITAMAGDQPAGGATIVSHTIAGQQIESTAADAVGVAQVGTADGALVTVLYPGLISALTPNISVVTAPLTDGMTIVGPQDDSSPGTIVGGLQIKPKNIQASSFVIQLGCATFTVASMPAVLDVGARCMGSDQNVDVLVTAMNGTSAVGYAAARVPMVNGMAQFDPPAWSTTYTMPPVTIASDVTASWQLISDGLPFTTPIGEVPMGLTVDRVIVTGDIGTTRETTHWYAHVPDAVTLPDDDFLAPITPSLAAGYTWSAANLGDAVDLRASWDVAAGSATSNAVPPGPHHVQWDAILSPDATDIAPPPVGLPPPPTAEIALRYVDGSMTMGFPATEIHVDTVVPPVTDGEIRVTQASGLR